MSLFTDERLLVAYAQCGDESAYWQLAGPYVGRLRFWLMKRFPGIPGDVVDAAEGAALDKARRAIKSFQGDSNFSTWLHRIAENCARDLLRKRGREVPIDAQDFDADAERLDRQASDLVDRRAYRHDPGSHHRHDPRLRLERKQRRELERRAIKSLTKRERQVYQHVRHGKEERQADRIRAAAADLRLRPDTVREHLHAAVAKIQRYVATHETPARHSLFERPIQ